MPTTTRRRWPGAGSCRRSTDTMTRQEPGAIRRGLAGCSSPSQRGARSLPRRSAGGTGDAAPDAATRCRGGAVGRTATFVFFNRPIVVLRARVLGRDPAERAESASTRRSTIWSRAASRAGRVAAVRRRRADHRRLPRRAGADAAGRRRTVRRNRRGGGGRARRAPAAGARRSGRKPARAGVLLRASALPPLAALAAGAAGRCGAIARARRAVGRQTRRHRRADRRPNRDRRPRRRCAPRACSTSSAGRDRRGCGRPRSRRDLRHGRLRPAAIPLHAALGRIDARVPAGDR